VQRKINQAARIERLRRRLHEVSAWRLAKVAHEREELAVAHAGMIEALGEGIMSYGPASLAGTRRVRRIERELAIAKVIEKDLESRALADGRLAKLAEGHHAHLRETRQAEVERRSLEDLIEATLAAGQASRKP
jgi:hypothetical protein